LINYVVLGDHDAGSETWPRILDIAPSAIRDRAVASATGGEHRQRIEEIRRTDRLRQHGCDAKFVKTTIGHIAIEPDQKNNLGALCCGRRADGFGKFDRR
jgi:hypothetical protein